MTGVKIKGKIFFMDFFYENETIYYVKLQEAYAVEKNGLGTWAEIGYKDPSGSSGGGKTSNFQYTNATTAGSWGAYNIVGMNECKIAKAAVWTVTSTFTSSTGNVISTPAVSDANCKNLTPNFCEIGARCATTATTP